MTHQGIIAQEVGELFPEMFIINNPRPTPVLSITNSSLTILQKKRLYFAKTIV